MSAELTPLLFNPGEIIGYKIKPEWKPQPASASCLYFALNPLKDYSEASNANIAAHRNFLFEMDGPKLAAQKYLLETKKELPFTLKTFSGNKSYHYIVALETDVGPDKYAEYWQVLKYLFRASAVDKTASNPSRLTRLPGAKRPEGKTQKLLKAYNRISVDQWENWLYTHPTNYADAFYYEHFEKQRLADEAAKRAAEQVEGEEPAWVIELLETGAGRIKEGNRHRVLIAAAMAGASLEKLTQLALLMGKSEEEAAKIAVWANNCKVD